MKYTQKPSLAFRRHMNSVLGRHAYDLTKPSQHAVKASGCWVVQDREPRLP